MNSFMNPKPDKYLKAKQRVAELKKFYISLGIYILVNIFFVIINYISNGFSYPWFWWITIPWGIGMAFQALSVFGGNLIFPKDWEERKIREFMEREQDDQVKESETRWE